MSVSLSYTGRLKSAALITPILEELRALAQEIGWKHKMIGPADYALVYGPVVTARGIHLTLDPEAGMFAGLAMLFDPEGRLVNETMLKIYSDEAHLRQMNESINPLTNQPMYRIWIPETEDDKKKYSWDDIVKGDLFSHNFIETHNLGPEKHILLCKLLRYLQKKYFRRLRVDDSSNYWRSGDASELTENIQVMRFFHGQVGKFFDAVAAKSLPKNATLKDLLDDLSLYLAVAFQQTPHKPVNKTALKRKPAATKNAEKRN